ncbi:hypothetical protein ABIA23_003734 [Sinorhizobium fredii]
MALFPPCLSPRKVNGVCALHNFVAMHNDIDYKTVITH